MEGQKFAEDYKNHKEASNYNQYNARKQLYETNQLASG